MSKGIDVLFSLDDLYQLIVEDVNSSDIGTYVCRVTNDVGRSSCSANLYVDRAVTVPQFVGKDEPPTELFEEDELRFVYSLLSLCIRYKNPLQTGQPEAKTVITTAEK